MSGTIALLPEQTEGISVKPFDLVDTSLILGTIHTYEHFHLFNKYIDVCYVPSTKKCTEMRKTVHSRS